MCLMNFDQIEVMRQVVVGGFLLNQFLKMVAIYLFPPVFLNHAELQRFIKFDSAKGNSFV